MAKPGLGEPTAWLGLGIKSFVDFVFIHWLFFFKPPASLLTSHRNLLEYIFLAMGIEPLKRTTKKQTTKAERKLQKLLDLQHSNTT